MVIIWKELRSKPPNPRRGNSWFKFNIFYFSINFPFWGIGGYEIQHNTYFKGDC